MDDYEEILQKDREEFVDALKYYFDIHFEEISEKKREDWIKVYLMNKKEFFMSLMEVWLDELCDISELDFREEKADNEF